MYTNRQNIMDKRELRTGLNARGNWYDPRQKLGMANTSLSILDLSSLGQQPMISRCGQYRIVFNGEVYNFVEILKELESAGRSFLSQTDTEVMASGAGTEIDYRLLILSTRLSHNS